MNNNRTDTILISIVTVVYNGAEHLEQTINSVINQTYGNIEYIVIDGGSTDGSFEIASKYRDRIAHLISEPDEGLYDAMNKGISLAKGDFIGLLNSDDWLETDAIERIVVGIKNHPGVEIIHGDRLDVDIKGTTRIRKYNPSKAKLLYYGMTYNHPSMYISKKIYSSNKYNTKLKIKADYQFVLNCVCNLNAKFLYINKPYVNYRLDGLSTKIGYKESVREGFLARRISGLSLPVCILAICLDAIVRLVYKVKNK